MPTMLQFKCYSHASQASLRIRRARYDRTFQNLPARTAAYADSLKQAELPVFEVEPTSHQFQMAGLMEETLVQVRGAPVRPPTKKHIEQATVAMVLVEAAVAGATKRTNKYIRLKPLDSLFACMESVVCRRMAQSSHGHGIGASRKE